MLYVIVIVMLLSLAMKFEIVSNFVAGIFGTTPEVVQDYATIALVGSIGLFLIWSGVAFAAIPVVGVALVVIGVCFLAYAIWTKVKPATTLSED